MLKQVQEASNEARIQERAKMQVEVQKVQDELDRVSLFRSSIQSLCTLPSLNFYSE